MIPSSYNKYASIIKIKASMEIKSYIHDEKQSIRPSRCDFLTIGQRIIN
jgi:hypothetical protein